MIEIFFILLFFILCLIAYFSSNNRKKSLWISVEGIIGAGKTTLIKSILPHLEDSFGSDTILVVDEPVEKWIESGHLERCTQEPYVAQTYFFHTRVQRFLELTKDGDAKIIISERSMISDRYIFWETTCMNGLVSELAQKTYPHLWSTWTKLLNGREPDLYIYLELDADTSQKRMLERNRSEEKDVVSIDYQKQLVEAHERVFKMYRTIKISSSRNFRDDPAVARDIAEQIIQIIKTL